MRILFVDDEQYRMDTFLSNAIGSSVTFAYNADSAIEILKRESFDIIFLDHDLAPEHYASSHPDDKNGQYLCRKIMEHDIRVPWIIVHSLNPQGAARMIEVLGSFYRSRALYIPMAWKLFSMTEKGWKIELEP